VALVGALPSGANAQTPEEVAKLLASDGTGGDLFGRAVALSGDTAVIGAAGDDDHGTTSGSAYVFVKTGDTWALQQKLTASDGAEGDRFGDSVAVEGDLVFVGATGVDEYRPTSGCGNGGLCNDVGATYVFTRDAAGQWTEQQRLMGSNLVGIDPYFGYRKGDSAEKFGSSISVSGDTVLIGARDGETRVDESAPSLASHSDGVAYVFVRVSGQWVEQTKLVASDGGSHDSFGGSVSLSGSTALIGAYGDADNGSFTGSAYVFVENNGVWTQHQKLTASGGQFNDRFGLSVSLEGNTAIIGAQGYGTNDAGAAFVYVRTGSFWNLSQTLAASDGAADDLFGRAVSFSGDVAVIGAPRDDDAGLDSGSVYVYARNNGYWFPIEKLTASDGELYDVFGDAVSVSGLTGLVGAWGGSAAGAVYVFAPEEAASDPIANAGEDQSVYVGDHVTLSGSGSDEDGDYPLTYSWTLIGRPANSAATLTGANTESPSFFADRAGTYTAELVVTDRGGAQSLPDPVVISTINTPPVADAGEDQSVTLTGTIVTLISASYDDDGDDITLSWALSAPAGSSAMLDDTTSTTPSFTADVNGDYTATLTVSDGEFNVVDTAVVSFANVAPVADAGENQAVRVADAVLLDGSNSRDDNGDSLSYLWSLVSAPAGSSASIDPNDTEMTSFVPDVSGTYVINLVVSDGIVESAPSMATITATTAEGELVDKLEQAIDVVNGLNASLFKNKNLKKNMAKHIGQALQSIDKGEYDDALSKIETVLRKTDGCANGNKPDPNDWLIDCDAQQQVYWLLIDAIALIDEILAG